MSFIRIDDLDYLFFSHLNARGVARASLLWKQIKARGLGASLSPTPSQLQWERSPGGDPHKHASFSAFQALYFEHQKKEFRQNSPVFNV